MIATQMTHSTIDIDGLGKRVRRMRELLGMSQGELAIKAKMPQTTIHKIETGKTVAPRVDTLEAIAEALGTSLRALLWVEGTEPDNPDVDELSVLFANLAPNTPVSRLRRFVRLYDMMNSHKRNIIEELMEVMAAEPAQASMQEQEDDTAVGGERGYSQQGS